MYSPWSPWNISLLFWGFSDEQGQIWIFDLPARASVDTTNRSICVSNHADNVVFKSLMINKQMHTLWKKIRSLFQKSRMFIWNSFSHYTLKCTIYLGIQFHSVLLKAPLSFITVSIPEQMSFRCEKSIISKTLPVVIWVD